MNKMPPLAFNDHIRSAISTDDGTYTLYSSACTLNNVVATKYGAQGKCWHRK